jgi:hypothetical protein
MKYTLAGIVAFWLLFGACAAVGYPIIGALAGAVSVAVTWVVLDWVDTAVKPKF